MHQTDQQGKDMFGAYYRGQLHTTYEKHKNTERKNKPSAATLHARSRHTAQVSESSEEAVENCNPKSLQSLLIRWHIQSFNIMNIIMLIITSVSTKYPQSKQKKGENQELS